MESWAINPDAFEPAPDDVDGLSLFREDFVTKEHLASSSTHSNGVRVAHIVAKECTSLHLSLRPAPDPHELPGHVLIPEMPYVKTLKTKAEKRKVHDFAQQLAQIASRHKVYVPRGLPDPVVRTKS